MIAPILQELDKLQGKKVELVLANGRRMRCKPKHFIEPEDEEFTYLVETYESFGGYPVDSLYELKASEIDHIELLTT